MNDQATQRTASAAKQPPSYSLPSGERVPVLFRLQNLQRPGDRLAAASQAASPPAAAELHSAGAQPHAVETRAEPLASSAPLPPVLDVAGPSWMRRNAYRLTVLGLLGVTGPLLLSNHLRSNSPKPAAAATRPAAAPAQAVEIASAAPVETLDFEGPDGPPPAVAATRPVAVEPVAVEPVAVEPLPVETPSLAVSVPPAESTAEAAPPEPAALADASPQLLTPESSEPSPSDVVASPAETQGTAAPQDPAVADVQLDSPWRPSRLASAPAAGESPMRLTSAAKPETPAAPSPSAASAIPQTSVPDMEDPHALLEYYQRIQAQTPEQAVQESRQPAAVPPSASVSQASPEQASYGQFASGQFTPPAAPQQTMPAQQEASLYAAATDPQGNTYGSAAQASPAKPTAYQPLFPEFGSPTPAAPQPQQPGPQSAYQPLQAPPQYAPQQYAPQQYAPQQYAPQQQPLQAGSTQPQLQQHQLQQPYPGQDPQRTVYAGSTAASLYLGQPGPGGQQPSGPAPQPAANLSSQPAPSGYGFTR